MFACLHAPGNLSILRECAEHFSPLIEETSPDTAIVDVRGLRLIFGMPQKIAEEIQKRLGIPTNIAIASNPDAAVHAGRGIAGITVIPPGRESVTLAPLPLYLLGGSPEFAHSMDMWGIRTFGEFAALPPLGVTARLGEEGTHLYRLAQGAGQRLLRVRGDPLQFEEEYDCESPIELLESLLFLVAQMLERICARLHSHSLATNEIRLRLQLERAPDHSVTLRLPVPMLDTRAFLKLLQLELSDRPVAAPVDKIRITLVPVALRTVQHGLFVPAAPEPEKLEITLARIRHLVGAANVGAPKVIDTYRPDSFRMGPLIADASPAIETAPGPKIMLRRFRPPGVAQVWFANGEPMRISSAKATGTIVAFAGPWRTSGDWWAGEPWDHKEWDIQLACGLFRIRQDCRVGAWFVDGGYD